MQESSQLTILVVDDCPEILQMLVFQLEFCGIHCISTQDPNVAVDIIRRLPLDAVVTDMIMPQVNGLWIAELCERVGLPCIAISGVADLYSGQVPKSTILLEKDGDMNRLLSAIVLQIHRQKHMNTRAAFSR